MELKKDKGGALEISFGWLFAIIAGIVIIFLAIYISSKLIGTQQESISAETGKEIGILLNPLETSFETSQTTSITIPTETKIHNECDLFGYFGKQDIQLDQKSFNKWIETDTKVSFYNKYIFSTKEIIGKKFYIFSKPFSFPFKIADLMYMTSANERYCFVDAPSEIAEELAELNQSNLINGNCNENDIEVCFGTKNCDVKVDFSENYVEKDNKKMYFGNADESRTLMYAAIFSEKEVYECQLKRLMMRVEEISSLYISKELLTRKKGCDDSSGGDLATLMEIAGSFNQSEDFEIAQMQAENVNDANEARRCLLW